MDATQAFIRENRLAVMRAEEHRARITRRTSALAVQVKNGETTVQDASDILIVMVREPDPYFLEEMAKAGVAVPYAYDMPVIQTAAEVCDELARAVL